MVLCCKNLVIIVSVCRLCSYCKHHDVQRTTNVWPCQEDYMQFFIYSMSTGLNYLVMSR